MTRDGGDLLELPFDQYQRYSVTAQLLAELHVEPGARLLDVGGGPGPIERFVPDHVAFVADLEKSRDGLYVNASGAALPFRTGSFSAVVTFDTLEHVFPEDRHSFVQELQRVSHDVVILTAPFQDPDVELAEAALAEFFALRFNVPHPMLAEHLQFGLPNLDEVERAFRDGGWATATLPSGLLSRWLAMMLLHEELRANNLPQLGKLHAYYNSAVGPSDCRDPAYRHVIIASRVRAESELRAAADALRSPEHAPAASSAFHAIASAVFAQRVGTVVRSSETVALETELDALRRQVADLERQVADRDAHLIELRVLNEKLLAGRRPVSARVADRLSDWWKGRRL
ncbi:MAG: methyltransferase domain-containing protein [Acidimicrobiia bacterium]